MICSNVFLRLRRMSNNVTLPCSLKTNVNNDDRKKDIFLFVLSSWLYIIFVLSTEIANRRKDRLLAYNDTSTKLVKTG